MTKPQLKTQPTWTDVKAKLALFDRPALLDLLHHLYAAHKDNQVFLHARFGLGDDVLEPYKKTIDRWVWPDPFRNQDTSVSKAKQAISDYKKAVGDPAGLTELMVFYCEQAAGYCRDIGYQEEGFFDALVRMFEQALKSVRTLPATAMTPTSRDSTGYGKLVTTLATASAMTWTSSWPNTPSVPVDRLQVAGPRRSRIAHTCRALHLCDPPRTKNGAIPPSPTPTSHKFHRHIMQSIFSSAARRPVGCERREEIVEPCR